MKKELSRKLIILNLCLAAILALMANSLAAYTSLSSVKRVVSTTSAKQFFSSNVLYAYDGEKGKPSTRVMSFSTEAESNTFNYTIGNYAQGDKTTWATRDISYTLTVTLLDSAGEKVTDTAILDTYFLNGESFSSLDTIQKTLVYRSAQVTEDTYVVSVPSSQMNDYRICMIAISDHEEYQPIGRIIAMTESSSSTHWSGSFTDGIVDDDRHTPSELGSINTRISGQENEIIVISWETAYVEIDPWFLEDLGSDRYEITIDGTTKTLKFEVGGEDQPSQYDISFYRTTSAKSLEESWSEMKAHIQFSYESKSTTE
jgi:hypothetical protein